VRLCDRIGNDERARIVMSGFWFFSALAVAVIGSLVAPFAHRLQGTSLWAGRVLVSPEASHALPRGLQAALMDGWPSNIGLLLNLPFIAAALGFVYAWWGGILVFAVSMAVSTLAGRTPLASNKLERYLVLLWGHAQQRAADYQMRGDRDPANAVRYLSNEVQTLLSLYAGSGVKAPDVLEAKQTRFGDRESLLRQGPLSRSLQGRGPSTRRVGPSQR